MKSWLAFCMVLAACSSTQPSLAIIIMAPAPYSGQIVHVCGLVEPEHRLAFQSDPVTLNTKEGRSIEFVPIGGTATVIRQHRCVTARVEPVCNNEPDCIVDEPGENRPYHLVEISS